MGGKSKVYRKAGQLISRFLASGVSLSLHPDFLQQSKKRRYLLGISGGRDSVALLHLLLDAGYRNLVLCHLNHGLRGNESGQDAAFVRRLAKKHNLPCKIERVDVATLMADHGESMELCARNARLRFFRTCAKLHRCHRVLLAHHADDQAETILFNLLRGSNGLKGMQMTSTYLVDDFQLELIRPLLLTQRHDIDHYLSDNNIRFRDDTSNTEPVATRNRLRNEVIPLLNEIMGREVTPAILRAASTIQEQQIAVEDLLESMQLTDPQGRLFLPKLALLPFPLQSTAIHGYLKQQGITNISTDLLNRCITLVSQSKIAKVNLPGGQFLRRKERRIFVS